MPVMIWVLFLTLVVVIIALDLGVFHRKAHVISLSEALTWTAVWVGVALAFNVVVYLLYEYNWHAVPGPGMPDLSGKEAALQYFTGYLLEESLSVDNIFVIALILAYFRVPAQIQHRVLFWGILGAIVLRGIMIGIGAALIHRFDWIVYIFGALLIASAIKLMVTESKHLDPEKNFAVRLVRRFFPVSPLFDGARFFTKLDGDITAATPLLLALVLVETSDVMFAVDSIPAIFAITSDPFLVFSSNIFAIMGLRSLYFALAGLMDQFKHLETSLVVLLFYVGVKTLLSHHFHIPNLVSLGIIAAILGAGIAASLVVRAREQRKEQLSIAKEFEEVFWISYRQARRLVILLIGGTVLLIGVAMIVLPGPAFVTIPLGLAILAAEFAWARRWLVKIKTTLGEMPDGLGRMWRGGESETPPSPPKPEAAAGTTPPAISPPPLEGRK